MREVLNNLESRDVFYSIYSILTNSNELYQIDQELIDCYSSGEMDEYYKLESKKNQILLFLKNRSTILTNMFLSSIVDFNSNLTRHQILFMIYLFLENQILSEVSREDYH